MVSRQVIACLTSRKISPIQKFPCLVAPLRVKPTQFCEGDGLISFHPQTAHHKMMEAITKFLSKFNISRSVLNQSPKSSVRLCTARSSIRPRFEVNQTARENMAGSVPTDSGTGSLDQKLERLRRNLEARAAEFEKDHGRRYQVADLKKDPQWDAEQQAYRKLSAVS